MKFEILDNNVSLTMNIFLVIANIINLVYNLPQIIKTYKSKSTGDFSEWFLLLRFLGNLIWIGYAVEINSMLMLINTLVTVLSSLFIGYYKIIEIYNDRKKSKYLPLTNLDIESDDNLGNLDNDEKNNLDKIIMYDP